MKVLSDTQRLFNHNPFVIYFTPSAKVRPDVKKALQSLNEHQEFTRGIFRFETKERSLSDNDEAVPKLIKTLNSYNMIAMLVDDHTGVYKYAVGKLNFNLGNDEVERSIHGFIVEVCKLNVSVLDLYLNDPSKLQEMPNEQMAKMRKMFLNAISMRGYHHGILARLMGSDKVQSIDHVLNKQNDNFAREVPPETIEKLREIGKAGDIEYILSWCQDFFCSPDKNTYSKIAKDYQSHNYTYVRRSNRIEIKPDVVPEIKIEICKTVTKTYKYKEDRKVYGYKVVITVNGESFPIVLKGKYQEVLFMCILLRKKLGEKLYRHEFFNNEKGNSADTRLKRANSTIWFNKVYYTIYNKPSMSFDRWIDGMRKNAGHNLDNAKSAIISAIGKALASQPSAIYYCTLNTKGNQSGDTFFNIRIAPEDIIIPEEFQPLLDDFYDIMQVDKPE